MTKGMTNEQLYFHARNLMDQHGLQSWRFEVGRSRRRFGVCKYGRKKIIVSGPLSLINDDAEVRNTILHEIAHALVGPGEGHGHVWQQRAQAIGCNGQRCHDAVMPGRKWTGTCPGCQRTIQRDIRKRIACVRCCPRFDVRFLFTWKEN